MDIRPDDCLDTCSGSEDEACSDRDADLDGESTLDGSNGDNGEQPPRKRGKISRELPPEAIAVFKNWMLSEKNFAHPYPSVQEQAQLLEITGLNKRQLKNWFTNARRRIWKPLVLQRQKGGQPDTDVSAAFPAPEQPEYRPPGVSDPAAGDCAPAAPEHTVAPYGGPVGTDNQVPMVRSAESALGGGTGSIVMSLAEFENPSKVHTFEVPAELYLEGTEELTNKNKNVIMDAVAVAANARCLMCTEESVDVQAVPCQHLLHTRCLRKWMQGAGGAGVGHAGIIASCPICSIGITRVVLAVPCVCRQQAVYRGRASSELTSQGPVAGAPPVAVEAAVNISQS